MPPLASPGPSDVFVEMLNQVRRRARPNEEEGNLHSVAGQTFMTIVFAAGLGRLPARCHGPRLLPQLRRGRQSMEASEKSEGEEKSYLIGVKL